VARRVSELLSYLGIVSLCICLLVSLAQIKISYLKSNVNYINYFNLSLIQFVSCLLSFLILIYIFITSDFNFSLVYQNSHTEKPMIYKLSGSWGNHEGSLLMWILILTIFNFMFALTSKVNIRLTEITVGVQSFLILGFLLFLLFTSNPFSLLSESPNEGLGLNPILQDPFLAIHPPILYLGYVGFSLIFSLAIAGLLLNNIDKNWASIAKKWTLSAWVLLTAGIGLGSYWAYNELGWGGYWFWDPVENASLMPWLAGTALIHCVSILEKRNTLQSWTVLLSILTFALSLIGTFLVRSGILNSVHAFASDPSRGLFILAFLLIVLIASLFIFARKGPFLDKEIKYHLLSRETGILVNNWLFLTVLFIVFLGTVYPIFTDIVLNENITVGPKYYIFSITPIIFLFIFAMIITPFLNWSTNNYKILIQKIYKPTLLSVMLIFSISLYFDKLSITEISLLILSSILIMANLNSNILFKNNSFYLTSNIGRALTHAGFALLIISIIANASYAKEKITQAKVDDKIIVGNYDFIFSSISQEKEKNYHKIIANFEMQQHSGTLKKLSPEIRFYNNPPTITSETSIARMLFRDIYIVMNVPENQEFINVRIHIKPFMNFIWVSILMMMIGGLFSISYRIKNS
jgi:cytochrome c-type biogenesis protein CcmF